MPAQSLFLEHISSVYPHMLLALPILDLAKLITLMFDSVSRDAKLMHPKLVAILHAVKSPIFADGDSRHLLLPTCCDHVKTHLLGNQNFCA